MGYSTVAKGACREEPDLLQVGCPVLPALLLTPSGVGREQVAMSRLSWLARVRQGALCCCVILHPMRQIRTDPAVAWD